MHFHIIITIIVKINYFLLIGSAGGRVYFDFGCQSPFDYLKA